MNLEKTIKNNYSENSTLAALLQDYSGKTKLTIDIKDIFKQKENLLDREIAWFGYIDQENGTKLLTFILNGEGL